MAVDILSETLTILEDNWDNSNTNSFTPKFIKITDQKKIDFNSSKSWVIAHRQTAQNITPAGTGPSGKHEEDRFMIDIRVIGVTQEAHFLNVVEEVKRLLDDNKINPFSPTITEAHTLEFNGLGPDLSNKTFNLFRRMLPVQLARYNIQR